MDRLAQIVEGVVGVTGAGLTAWGAASHNTPMMEAGMFLICLSVGIVPNMLRPQRDGTRSNPQPPSNPTQ